MTDEDKMPIGKYKGEKLANVPASYLLWLWDQGNIFGPLKDYIKENLDVLRAEVNYQNKIKQ